jgi:hypothetical protein
LGIWGKIQNIFRFDKPSAITWRVIRLGGPLPRAVGLVDGDDDEDKDDDEENYAFGVVVSTDAMLQHTHTLLYCPLINGVRKGKLLGRMPWHVTVEIESPLNSGQVGFSPALMVTKVVLPISPNEVNPDGLDYGKLKPASRRLAAETLRKWFPAYKEIY